MSLRSFLDEMEAAGKVVHVKEEVSPRFEISSMMKALDKGPMLFFNKVEGYPTKIVANVCGNRQRLCEALAVTPEQLYQKLIEAYKYPAAQKTVNDAPVKEVIEQADLSKIPVLTHFEKDAAPYITSALVSARSSDGKVENVSVHRLQVLDNHRLAIRLVPRHLFKLWETAKEAGEDLEVAIAIGLHPTVLLAATSPVPFGVTEFGVASTLLEERFNLTTCEQIDARIPAEAEIVLEGEMSVTEEVVEGPLVDLTGTYDIQRKQPIIRLVGMMHRKDPIYQALLPSGTEHQLLMGLPRETKIWEAVSNVVPTIKAINLSGGGGGWLHAFISIEKQTDGDAKNALLAAFSGHPSLKHAVVVDSDINVYDLEEVEWAIATRFQAKEDLLVVQNVRGSTLDPSAKQETGLTTKVGVDATRPLTEAQEKFERAKIPYSKRANELIDKIRLP